MTREEARALSPGDRMRMSHGKPKTTRSSHTHGGHSQSAAGWSLNDTHDGRIGTSGEATKRMPGRYKAQMPRNHVRYHNPAGPA